MTATRVAIVEDHPVFRDGLEMALAPHQGIEVVASVGTLADARRVVATSPVDVVLLDLGLPDGSGLDLLSTLRARRSPTVVIVLTMNDDPQVVLSAVRAERAATCSKVRAARTSSTRCAERPRVGRSFTPVPPMS
jgi:DNA-binding NarL/FixJ family response regulator